MWQTVVTLLVVTAVLIYVIRHYVRMYRSKVPTCSCSGCSERCSAPVPENEESCACREEGSRPLSEEEQVMGK